MEFLPLLPASSLWNRNQAEKDSAQTIAKNMITYDLVPLKANKACANATVISQT